MKLVDPTDFDILEVMEPGQRETAPNIAEILDKDRQYISNQLSDLAGKGLVKKVGPSVRSGMYVITEKGQVAVRFRESYSHEAHVEFENLIEQELNK